MTSDFTGNGLTADTPLQTQDDVRRARERLCDLLFEIAGTVGLEAEHRVEVLSGLAEILRDADLSIRRKEKEQRKMKRKRTRIS